MKKNTIILIACTAALVAAGGGYAALMLNDGKNTSSTSESISEIDQTAIPVSLLDFEKNDIQSVSVKNSDGEYKAIPVEKSAQDDTIELTIEGFEDLDINTTLTSSLLNSSSALNSESTADEQPSDLGKYGLKEPSAEVTIKGKSAEKTILIGAVSPIQGQTYCMEKDGDAVYLVTTSNVSVFLNSAEKFVSTSLLEEPETAPRIEKISIDRDDLDYDIVLEYDKSQDEGIKSGSLATHYMTKPVFAYLDSEKSQPAIKGFYGLSAQSVLSAHPTETEITASGLDKPFAVITMNTDEPKTYTLKLGKKINTDDGSYYPAMFDDNKVIYAMSPDSVCWADIQPGDITSKLVFGVYFWDIGRLDIEVNDGEKVKFEAKGSSEEDHTVTKNGKSCKTERFQQFYQFLLKTSAEEFVIDEKPEGEPVVSVEVETQDGKLKQKVEFYRSDGKKALISVNGTSCFKCRMAYVDLLIENLGKFDTNSDFVMNW